MTTEREYDYEAAERFQEELYEYLEEFAHELSQEFTAATVRKHKVVIRSLIEFATFERGVYGFEHFTKGIVNSQFRRSFYCHTDSNIPASNVKSITQKFFQFIEDAYGIKTKNLF